MAQLIVQHPALTDDALAPFAAFAGSAPERRDPSCAVWHVESSRAPATAAVEVRDLAETMQVDAAWQTMPARWNDFRLIAFDMDSTVITIECVDEIADYAGRKTEVAAITAAAMRGEIVDYAESLERRVALLAGLPESVLDAVYEQRLRLTVGVERLLTAARDAGLRTLLVSGGFTHFTDRLEERLGFDWSRSNRLEVEHGRLTGRLLGEIVGPEAKREIVRTTCESIGCETRQAIVVGDGANDLPMMRIAGLSVAFHAKPVVQMAATHALNHCGLDAVLNLLSFAPTGRIAID